jgi:hemerythrin superfamily protein
MRQDMRFSGTDEGDGRPRPPTLSGTFIADFAPGSHCATHRTDKESAMARANDPFESQDEDSDESEDEDLVEQDAVSLLSSDHLEVKQMFEEYRQLVESNAGEDRRAELAAQICSALTVHAEIEEDIFYPAMRESSDDDLLLDQAEVAHGSAKELIEQIESMDPGDALYDARVLVLGEYVEHHVQEEENEIFPQAEKSGIDLDELGAELAERKRELMAELEED